MKRSIRFGVFETNSSSTHSLTMCSREDYDAWKKGEVLFNYGSFYTKDEAVKELQNSSWFAKYNPDFDWNNENKLANALKEDGYKTYNDYWDNCDLETFEDSYTTKNGDEIVAFGEYGYDG